MDGAVIALLAIALAASALAHRVPSAKDLHLASYQLSFGGNAGLCGGDAGEGEGSGQSGCKFCQLTGASILPEPGFALRAAETFVLAKVILPAIRRAESLAPTALPPSRAPPLA